MGHSWVELLLSASFLSLVKREVYLELYRSQKTVERQNNDTKPPVGNGGVRRVCLEASGGAGPERTFPGVSHLLPGRHPAAYGRVKRSSFKNK